MIFSWETICGGRAKAKSSLLDLGPTSRLGFDSSVDAKSALVLSSAFSAHNAGVRGRGDGGEMAQVDQTCQLIFAVLLGRSLGVRLRSHIVLTGSA